MHKSMFFPFIGAKNDLTLSLLICFTDINSDPLTVMATGSAVILLILNIVSRQCTAKWYGNRDH